MRLPFLASGPAKPPEYRPNPKALFGQDQRITATAAAGIPRAHFRQSQEITGKARPAAAFRQDQRITAQARPRAPFRQDQRITATARANANLWPNGFKHQHEIRLRAWGASAGSVANFLLPLAEQSDAFKLAPAGEVESSDGYDIRFETSAGVKLGHVLIHYDGTAGRIIALVNMPRNFAAAESIFMYLGKAGLGSSEESAANARAGGWLAWFKGGSGTDLTDQARNLTMAGTPGVTTLLGWPAYDFDGLDDAGAQASSSYANGLAAISCVSFAQADATDQLRELYNISVDTAGELGLRYKGSDGRLVAIAKFGASVYSYESANGSQSTGPQAVAYVAAAGTPLRMAINGAMDTPAAASGSPTGTLSVSDTLEWGKGNRGSIGFWNGPAAFLALRSGAMSVAEMESMTAALVDPRRVYGVGASNLVTVANRGPIAQPLFVEATAGVAQNFNVAAAAYDPNGDALTATDVSVVSGAATATVPSTTGGNVRLTGNSGLAQDVVLDFGIRDGGNKRSRGRLYASVRVPPFVIGTAKHPYDLASWSAYPASKTRVVGFTLIGAAEQYGTGGDELRKALADWSPGEQIVLADGTYTGDYTINRAGTAAAKMALRSRNHLQAVFSGRILQGGSLSNAEHTWLSGLRFTYQRDDDKGLDEKYPVVVRSRNTFITNCWFSDVRSGVRYIFGTGLTGCKLNYNTFETAWPTSWAHATIVLVHSIPEGSPGPSNFEWAYNYLLDDVAYSGDGGNERHAFSVQPSKPNSAANFGDNTFVMHHNFTRGRFARHVYSKRHCTMQYNVSDGYGAGQFGFRHGHHNRAKGAGGIIEGNYVRGPVMMVNGGGAIVRGNDHGSGTLRLFAGTVPTKQGDVTGIYNAADNTIVCDHKGTIVVGYRNQNDDTSDTWGGKVNGVDIYKGNVSSPIVNSIAGGVPDPPTPDGYRIIDGFGSQPVITPITIADLAGVAGCDGHTATVARP